jgi:hypothetical protein
MSQDNEVSFLRSIKVVAWSFLGIRKSSEFQKDIERVTPLHVIGLVIVVNLVVAK